MRPAAGRTNLTHLQMSRRRWALLLLTALAAALLSAAWIRSPGNMDAEYYLAIGRRLAGGERFSEAFLWKYLDDPQGLPHPSNL